MWLWDQVNCLTNPSLVSRNFNGFSFKNSKANPFRKLIVLKINLYMKPTLIFLLLISIFSCEREAQFQGKADVTGYCYDACSGLPLANYLVKFNHEGAILETTSNSNGYFEINDSYSFMYLSNKSVDQPTLICRDPQFEYRSCSEFRTLLYNEFKGDTIFFNQSVKSAFKLKLDPNQSYTSADTLFLLLNEEICGGTPRTEFRATSPFASFRYNTYYVGPFTENQIVDSLQTYVRPYLGSPANLHGVGQAYFIKEGVNGISWIPSAQFTEGTMEELRCNSIQEVELDLTR